MSHPDHPRLAAAAMAARRPPRHRRLHRARLGLRVPADPRGAHRRHPRPLPPAPGRGHGLVPRPRDQRGADGPGRRPARPAGRRPPGRWIAGASASPPPPSRSSVCRAGSCWCPASAETRSIPPARPRPSTLRAAAHVARQGHRRDPRLRPDRHLHRARGHRLHPRDRSPVDGLVGYAAAALIATGVVIPLLEAASLTNFAGYVAWCVWLSPWPSSCGVPGLTRAWSSRRASEQLGLLGRQLAERALSRPSRIRSRPNANSSQ